MDNNGMGEPEQIGDWSRVDVLGSGGFGIVTVWQHRKTNDCVAVKKCKTTDLNDKQKKRWIKEVDALKSLQHPNIIKFKEIPQDFREELNRCNPTGLPLLTMEFCTGGNLRRVLNLPENSSGLPEKSVRSILGDISRALYYMHERNIAHRDIKPENIVLEVLPERTRYKLIDLGYAKELDTTVSFVGTFRYLAPEIFFLKDYDVSVDYWSFGILAYEIMTGSFPFSPINNLYLMFKNIERKNPDDICICASDSGNLLNSSQIKHDTRVSVCFKELMERWLKCALQFDPKMRGKCKDGDIFGKLWKILAKSIVVVFSFVTMEFYSYEVDDCTMIGTLKDWIARDLRVGDPNDLLLLTGNGLNQHDDCLVQNSTIVQHHTIHFYVFHKNDTIRIPEQFSLPHSIVRVVSSPITTPADKERLYRTSIFFIETERALSGALSECNRLYIAHLKSTFTELTDKINAVSIKVLKLSTKIHTFMLLYHKYCAIYKQFLEEVKQDVLNAQLLIQRYKNLHRKLHTVEKFYRNTLVVFQENDTNYLYETAIKTARKKPEKNKEILNLISNAIKMKVNILSKDEGAPYQKFLNKAKGVLKETTKLLQWADDLHHNFNIDLKKITFHLLVTFKDTTNNNECTSEAIIKENMYLRALFEGSLMGHLEDFKTHRNACDLSTC